MPIKFPTKPEIVRFVHYAHTVEQLKVSRKDIDESYAGKGKNPFVMGMFDALNYAFRNLLNSPDFPCKDISLITNMYRSYDALYWLRELHAQMTLPIVKETEKGSEDYNVSRASAGTYRSYEMSLAFCMAPSPHLIPPLLHNWFMEICKFHEKVKDKIDSPYAISREEAYEMERLTNDTCLFMASVQPFDTGSNRLGRLVENLLRLTWRLPWKEVPGVGNFSDREYKEWVKELNLFQEQNLRGLVKAAEATNKEFGN